MNRKHPQKAVTEPEIQAFAVFTSLLAAVALKSNVSRQPSNSRGRKGTPQGPFRIQASHRREVRDAILHYQRGWKGSSSVSLRRVEADRIEAVTPFELQPRQEKDFEPHQ